MPDATKASASSDEAPRGARDRAWLKWWPRAALVLLLVGSITWFAVWLSANPALAAFICPSCFGLEHHSGRVWIEPRLTRSERTQLATDLAEARKRVVAVYGAVQADPVVLVCGSDDCDKRLGGSGIRGATYGWHVARISPRGRTAVVIAHELAHAELHQRVGWWGLLMRGYPAWFDEGLAVLVSRDPRALDITRQSQPRCRVAIKDSDVEKLPKTSAHWSEEMWRTRDLYERAACAVARWYQTAGRKGLETLVDDLRAGRNFQDAFIAAGKR